MRGTGGRRLKVGVSFDAYHKAGAKGATIILQGAPENGDQTHAPLSRTAVRHMYIRSHDLTNGMRVWPCMSQESGHAWRAWRARCGHADMCAEGRHCGRGASDSTALASPRMRCRWSRPRVEHACRRLFRLAQRSNRFHWSMVCPSPTLGQSVLALLGHARPRMAICGS